MKQIFHSQAKKYVAPDIETFSMEVQPVMNGSGSVTGGTSGYGKEAPTRRERRQDFED
jgi:hypothetical protein